MFEHTENLRDLMLQLKVSPNGLPPFPRDVPVDVMMNVRRYVLERLDQGVSIDDAEKALRELSYGRFEFELRTMFQNLVGLGADKDRINRLLFCWADKSLLNTTPSFQNDVDRAIFRLFNPEHGRLGLRIMNSYYLSDYARHNNLLAWDGEEWKVTALGNVFLRVPVLQAIRFLLSLENYLSAGVFDEWHMPLSFLQTLLDVDSAGGQVEENKLRTQFRVWDDYAERLADDGLVSLNWERRYNKSIGVKCSKLGRQIFESLTTSESSPLASAIGVLIEQELAYTSGGFTTFNTPQELKELRQIIEESSIVGEQKPKILAGLESFKTANYISTHLSLIPAIEGILRNIVSLEHIEGLPQKAMLQNLLEKFRADGVISANTAGWIASLDRNGVLHGNLNPSNEMAFALCLLAMNVISYLHSDYDSYRTQKSSR
jgi:hypothetical protein